MGHILPRTVRCELPLRTARFPTPKDVVPSSVHFVRKVLERTTGVDDDVGDVQTLLAGCLGTNPGPRVLLRTTIPLDDTSHLLGRVDVNPDDRVKFVSSASFHEQRNVVNHHDLPVRTTGFFINQSGSLLDQRMNDSLQTSPGNRIGKDDGPQRRTVQGTVAGEHLLTESLDDLAKPLRSGGHDVVGKLVVIDDDGSSLSQQAGNRRLATGDSARQAYPNDAVPVISIWHQAGVFSSFGVADPPGAVMHSSGVSRQALPD